MILEERTLSLKEAGNIFKMVAEALDENIHTQVIISTDILKELRCNNCEYNVYFHNYLDVHNVSVWYTLHESHAFSPRISNLGIRMFGHEYSQVTRFSFRNYNFAKESYKHGEFIFYDYDIQKILFINVK